MTPAVLIAVLVNTAMAIERWHEDRGDIWVTQTGKSQPVNRTADHPGGVQPRRLSNRGRNVNRFTRLTRRLPRRRADTHGFFGGGIAVRSSADRRFIERTPPMRVGSQKMTSMP